MTKIITELKKEHRALFDLMSQELDHKSDPVGTHKNIMKMKKMLMDHLAKEDKYIYPALLDPRWRDSYIQPILNSVIKGKQELVQLMDQFYSKYTENSIIGSNYDADFKKLFVEVWPRILNEELILFTEFENIINESDL